MAISVFILLILGLDLASKYLVRRYLAASSGISIIGEFFTLTYVENRGAAFGIFSQKNYGPILLLIFSFVLTLALVYLLTKLKHKPLRYGLALVIAGSLGNALDRLLRGFVTDFLTFKFGSWYFPSFNLADSAIVLGCIWLAALIIWDPKAQRELDSIFSSPQTEHKQDGQ